MSGNLPIFLPPVWPSTGSEVSREAQVRSVSFGDGYTQGQPKGINNIKTTLPLAWEILHPSHAAAIDAFLTTQNYAPFWYQAFNEAEYTKWTCKQWKVKSVEGGQQVNATLERYFGVEGGQPPAVAPVLGAQINPPSSLGSYYANVIVGAGIPSNSIGVNGDYFFDSASRNFYGPKANGAWPSYQTNNTITSMTPA